jgi:hypothetical protein
VLIPLTDIEDDFVFDGGGRTCRERERSREDSSLEPSPGFKVVVDRRGRCDEGPDEGKNATFGRNRLGDGEGVDGWVEVTEDAAFEKLMHALCGSAMERNVQRLEMAGRRLGGKGDGGEASELGRVFGTISGGAVDPEVLGLLN